MQDAPSILIMDDDPDICTMLQIMLEYKHYRVYIAENEKQARTLLAENKIDLIIMDMLLSGADGTDICRRFKNEKELSSIPILMFSAHPSAEERSAQAGADGFIGKPFEMSEMFGKVKELIKE